MSYLVFARKFRPGGFQDVTGQEHVTKTLKNSILRGKVAHAYLFGGPRGVGKTSIARIFSKALNCPNKVGAEPCLECAVCKDIGAGVSLGVREIDGASHNSVDNVRDLIDSFRALPPPGYAYKIYIIDEVHMLSIAAFNALLKSLEEPPPNTVFILATTEVHKIPETVISRCQRQDFRALTLGDVESRLAHIAASEKIEVDPKVFRLIARLSEGSMRDSQSLFDRVQSFCEGAIKLEDAEKVLGVVGRQSLFALSKAVFARDVRAGLDVVNSVFSSGMDPSLFLKEFASHWREVLLATAGGAEYLRQVGVPEEDANELMAQVNGKSQADINDICAIARDGADMALRSSFPKYAVEALAVRLCTREPVASLAAIIKKVRSEGGVSSSPSIHPVGGQGVAASTNVATGRSPLPATKPEHPKAPVSTQTRALQQDSSAAVAITPTPSSDVVYDWQRFVDGVGSTGGRVLAEQLKRLSVDAFSKGVLTAKGPAFTVSYLKEKNTHDKLRVALEGFGGEPLWVINLTEGKSAGKPEPGSLMEVQQKQRAEAKLDVERAVASHPKIKSLQKAFPGSTIETIKIEEK